MLVHAATVIAITLVDVTGRDLSLVFALQIVTTHSLVPVPRVVIIELRFQIANHEGGMKTGAIGAVPRFNSNNDPVDSPFQSPKDRH
jgi:hypothetical protein